MGAALTRYRPYFISLFQGTVARNWETAVAHLATQDLEPADPLDLNELSDRQRAPREARRVADICVVISELLEKYAGAQRRKQVNECLGNWFRLDMQSWFSVVNFCGASLP